MRWERGCVWSPGQGMGQPLVLPGAALNLTLNLFGSCLLSYCPEMPVT